MAETRVEISDHVGGEVSLTDSERFGKLGRMIGNHPRLKESSRFLFIPGPDDAGPSTVLPRCGLPNSLTEELRDVIPNAIFSSNPCR
ncbi:hypothetical protein YC2023_073170 [Brassica napus]